METASQPTTYRVKLKSRRLVAENTTALYFEKPQNFSFHAGQSVDLTLPDPPETDSEGNVRTFTLASAPAEDDLMVATRIRDTAFKRVLTSLPMDASVSLEGPFGQLTLPEDTSRPLVFVAGGIGSTPFRSIVLQATVQKLAHRITLFYVNRRPEDAPFLEQFENLQQQNQNFTFVGTMTNPSETIFPWSGETGRVSIEMVSSYLQGIESYLYYVVGPPGMVKGVRTMLQSGGVEKSNIKTEEFVGY